VKAQKKRQHINATYQKVLCCTQKPSNCLDISLRFCSSIWRNGSRVLFCLFYTSTLCTHIPTVQATRFKLPRTVQSYGQEKQKQTSRSLKDRAGCRCCCCCCCCCTTRSARTRFCSRVVWCAGGLYWRPSTLAVLLPVPANAQGVCFCSLKRD